MLEKIVQTSERTLDETTHTHVIMPSLTIGLQCYSIDVVRDEATMGTGRVAKSLVEHATQHGLQTIGVAPLMLRHLLDGGGDTHLTAADVDD
jgi:hypothetical protein